MAVAVAVAAAPRLLPVLLATNTQVGWVDNGCRRVPTLGVGAGGAAGSAAGASAGAGAGVAEGEGAGEDAEVEAEVVTLPPAATSPLRRPPPVLKYDPHH